MAIGTAVKRVAGMATLTGALPPQAVIADQDTWITEDQGLFARLADKQ